MKSFSKNIIYLFACEQEGETVTFIQIGIDFMKNLFKTLLILTFLLSFTQSALAEDYANIALKKNYKKALDKGCKEIELKDPATAVVLGVFPGGGSFYTGRFGLGVADLLLWTFSPLWDAPLAWHKAKKLNMEETVFRCELQGNDL